MPRTSSAKPASTTRTGGFPIGFRRGGTDWQKDLEALIAWTKQEGFGALDLAADGADLSGQVVGAGLRLGAVDLPDWQDMIAADAKTRAVAVDRNIEYVQKCAAAADGPVNHFIVMLPKDPSLPRNENFGYMIDSLKTLAPVLESSFARLVVEGYPGAGALCCTPEGYRALFEQCPSPSIGINYDPSHLIRQGIDPLRFLSEFADRVFHVHAKDTELFPERQYEFGHQQPPTFGKSFFFGSTFWRYTIPGHGQMQWVEAFRILERSKYSGCVSVELEDDNFNGKETTEKLGLSLSRRFLEGC